MQSSVISSPPNDRETDADAVMRLFDACFLASHNTVLVRGDDEPVYLPADADCPRHRVVFAHGFCASALHEAAHWCIAGAARRRLPDYGYWYAPDGRNREQQRAFEQVEARPQALEWIFSKAAARRFRLSVDNLGGEATDPEPFRRAVWAALEAYCEKGLNARAERFRARLAAHFGGPQALRLEDFCRRELD